MRPHCGEFCRREAAGRAPLGGRQPEPRDRTAMSDGRGAHHLEALDGGDFEARVAMQMSSAHSGRPLAAGAHGATDFTALIPLTSFNLGQRRTPVAPSADQIESPRVRDEPRGCVGSAPWRRNPKRAAAF